MLALCPGLNFRASNNAAGKVAPYPCDLSSTEPFGSGAEGHPGGANGELWSVMGNEGPVLWGDRIWVELQEPPGKYTLPRLPSRLEAAKGLNTKAA